MAKLILGHKIFSTSEFGANTFEAMPLLFENFCPWSFWLLPRWLPLQNNFTLNKLSTAKVPMLQNKFSPFHSTVVCKLFPAFGRHVARKLHSKLSATKKLDRGVWFAHDITTVHQDTGPIVAGCGCELVRQRPCFDNKGMPSDPAVPIIELCGM